MSRRERSGRLVLAVLPLMLLGAAATQAAEDGAPACAGSARAERAAAELLERLQEREAQLGTRERLLEERSRSGAQARAEAEARMAELDGLRIAVEERLAQLERANEAWLGRLAGVYGRMPAEPAAAVLAELDPELAAALLGRMRASRAAAILAALPPRRAAELSGRLASAPLPQEATLAKGQPEVQGPASAR